MTALDVVSMCLAASTLGFGWACVLLARDVRAANQRADLLDDLYLASDARYVRADQWCRDVDAENETLRAMLNDRFEAAP